MYKAAKDSIGLKQISSADRYRVKMCLEEVKRTELMIKDIEREIKKLLKEVPYASHKRFLSEESFSWLKNFIVCLF